MPTGSSPVEAGAGIETLDKLQEAATAHSESSRSSEPVVEIELSTVLDEQGQPRVIQVRGAINADAVATYAEHLRRGGTFNDPIVVYEVTDRGGLRYIAAGQHRTLAALDAERITLPGLLRRGTYREAWRVAVTTNNSHGHRPTKADVMVMLQEGDQDTEWASLSAGDKAYDLGCSASTVNNAYKELGGRTAPVVAQRNGTTYTMKASSLHRVRIDDAVHSDLSESRAAAANIRNVANRARRLMAELVGEGATQAALAAYSEGQDQTTLESEREAIHWLADLLGQEG